MSHFWVVSASAFTAFLTPIVTVYIIGHYFTPKRMFEQTTSGSPPQSDGNWSFVALQYYSLIMNRTYRVWVTPEYICGLCVGGAIASPPPREVNVLDSRWQNPENYVDPQMESKYANVDLASGDFLSVDKANFRVARADVIGVDFYMKKWGMGKVPYSGRLVIRAKDGRKIECILLGRQDAHAIAGHLYS